MVLRLHYPFEVVQRVTLPQARLLRRHYANMDGHREISQTLIAIVEALFPADPEQPKPRQAPPPPRAEADVAGVMLPELVEALKKLAEQAPSVVL